MTAEIAILNKSAVALATDSAVTISGSKGKIFNTANKLFHLNKYHPIGLMIYNDANFLNTPWETIIKAYRTEIKNNLKDSIKEQADDFIEFIKKMRLTFIDDELLKIIKEFEINNILSELKNEIESKVAELTKDGAQVDIPALLNEKISLFRSYFVTYEYYNDFNDNGWIDFFKNNKWMIIRKKNEVFQKIPFSKDNIIDLIKLSYEYIHKFHNFKQNKTGIVITGFGINEYLPSLVNLNIKYFIDGNLLYKIVNVQEKVSQYSINPYGQPEMVYSYIRGVNPNLQEFVFTALSEMINKIVLDFSLIPQIITLNDNDKERLLENIKKLHDENLEEFKKKTEEYIVHKYINPVVKSIEYLPKEELAAVAESLVYLTFLRKRISDEPETVGGDIDVAVISKGDGFIWIKRKHYFKPELNPHFFKNYFK